MNSNDSNEYAIEMSGITKTFLGGKVVANDEINLFVKKNEVHALIGENGAGKSTLMSILFGIYNQDNGTIKINNELVNFKSAKDASKFGLGMVHQHFKLVDEFSIWENVILGEERTKLFDFIDSRSIKKRLQELVDKYNFNININKKVKDLTVGQQQKTEILKLLFRNVSTLIFDEPTAVLGQDEIQSFLKMIMDFKEQGKTIIIITHKLNEIKQVADRGTIIRRGKFVADFDLKDKTVAEISELMVGKKLEEVKNDEDFNYENGEVGFEVSNLDLYKLWKKTSGTSFKKTNQQQNANNRLNFKVHKGEIYAIAGVEGNGQSELALAIAGIIPSNKASMKIAGKEINNKSIFKRYLMGLANVPEDRHKYGLILDWPIAMNTISQVIGKRPFSNFGFIDQNSIYKHAARIIKKYDVRGTTRGTTDARLLSGGNQQKLIIGRELDREHEFIILVQPTRGMDLGAIAFIHDQILQERKKGKSILLISYELDEILGLADTIAVMQNGQIVEEGSRQVMTRQRIGELMAGGDK